MSEKKVAEKLRIKPATTLWLSHPEHLALIEPLPEDVGVVERPEQATTGIAPMDHEERKSPPAAIRSVEVVADTRAALSFSASSAADQPR